MADLALQVRADNLLLSLQGRDRQTLLDVMWAWRKAEARLATIRAAVREADAG